MTAIVLRGDARHLPLPDASVDLICTSPPFWGQRDYTDGCPTCSQVTRQKIPGYTERRCADCGNLEQGRMRCNRCGGRTVRTEMAQRVGRADCPDCGGAGHLSMPGQIGSEATWQEWLANLLDCTREWVRVLKPDGNLFVELGDKYTGDATSGGVESSGLARQRGGSNPQVTVPRQPRRARPAGKPKCLLDLPHRYSIACVDQLGLIKRANIVWCLSGGARVYARTPTGDRPIMLRDLARAYQPQNVQLWNGERWTQVLGWNRAPDRGGVIEIELRTGERIGCTTGHRWPTQRGVIRADEIRIGDVIQTTRLPQPEQPVTPRAMPDEDIGWLVGMYLAEGSRSEKVLQFAGHIRETARNERLQRIARMYHGSAVVYRTSENGVTCNVSGAVLRGIIGHYVGRGRTAKSKRLRYTAWQRSNFFLQAVAEGYLEGDGHYDAKNDRWRLSFGQNDELAADLRTLAARLSAKISLRRGVATFNDGRRFPKWLGEWRWTRSAHYNAKQDGEVIAIRVSRAREFYDVGVADDPHLFALASGVLTHNSKPNGLPESVTDRVRTAHTMVFHLVRQPRYYTAIDEIREPQDSLGRRQGGPNGRDHQRGDSRRSMEAMTASMETLALNPLGKLPGSVWNIPSQPLQVPAHLGVDHFAAWPMEVPRRLVLGWSPPGICVGCGQGRRPIVDVGERRAAGHGQRDLTSIGAAQDRVAAAGGIISGGTNNSSLRTIAERTITGYVCACPTPDAPTRPSVILDPFGGTGTTALVASMHGRVGVSIDRSADYTRLAAWRTRDPAERAKALQVPKPPPIPDGQDALFTI